MQQTSKKHIKIAFMDFWLSDYERLPLLRLLRKWYDVEICDEGYDYAIFSIFGKQHLTIPESCVSIFFTGENFCPDFNLCDYAIGFDYLTFGDRYIRIPLYYFDSDVRTAETRHLVHSKHENIEKKDFCSFLVSNGSAANPIRIKMYERLSQYKRIDSGGRYMNNIGGVVDDKYEFERKHKFCLVFENSTHSGYTTEKLVDAFADGAIPIYWGDPDITKVFNPKAFVWVRDENQIDYSIEQIKYLDQNEDAYMATLMEPMFVDTKYYADVIEEKLHAFFDNIFNQRLEDALRYSRDTRPKIYKDELRALYILDRQRAKNLFKRIKHKLVCRKNL